MLKLNRFFFDQAISIDNALTTNQIIHQIINQVKEVVDYVNSLETDAHEYTDAKVLALKTQLEHQISELETFLKGYADTKLVDAKNYTDSEIANLRLNYIDVKVSEIYETITALESRLDAKIDYTDAKLTNLIDSVKSELIELIKKGNSIIYSGYTGLLTALQDEIYNIYDIWAKFLGLTWDRFNLCFNSATTFLESVLIDNFNDPKKAIKVGDDIYHFKYTSNIFTFSINYISDTTATLTVTRSSGTFGTINAVSIANTLYKDEDIVLNVDNNSITALNVPISSLDYSYLPLQLGTYENSDFTAVNFFVFSKLNASESNKVLITYNSIEYLTNLHVPITYDFVTYYFYSDFANVFGVLTLDSAIQYGLNGTLRNFNRISNNPNNCNVGTQFGQNGQKLFNNTIDYFAEAVKGRIFNL